MDLYNVLRLVEIVPYFTPVARVKFRALVTRVTKPVICILTHLHQSILANFHHSLFERFPQLSSNDRAIKRHQERRYKEESRRQGKRNA